MIYFTKYAEQKFDILNKYKVFITREQIENAVKNPDEIKKRDKHFSATKEGTGVIYVKQGDTMKIITFFPTK